jgi:hypothetical protein
LSSQSSVVGFRVVKDSQQNLIKESMSKLKEVKTNTLNLIQKIPQTQGIIGGIYKLIALYTFLLMFLASISVSESIAEVIYYFISSFICSVFWPITWVFLFIFLIWALMHSIPPQSMNNIAKLLNG